MNNKLRIFLSLLGQADRQRRIARRLGLVSIYAAILTGCLAMAWLIRFDFKVPSSEWVHFEQHWWWLVLLKLVVLGIFRQFSGIMRYFSVPDLKRLAWATLSSSVIFLLMRDTRAVYGGLPRGVVLLDGLISLVAMGGIRLAWRLFCEGAVKTLKGLDTSIRRAAIVGAGDVGAGLVRELNARSGMGLRPVLFFDDQPDKWGSDLHGLPVVGPPETMGRWKQEFGLDKIIIAMPSASAKRIGEVVSLAREHDLVCVTVPAIDQITSGQVRLSRLRPVEIEDLLGREPVALEMETIRHIFQGRVVMVTGAGGSIGSEICRQIACLDVERLLLVDLSEMQLFLIEQELIALGHGEKIAPLTANVMDEPRMRFIFKQWQPTVVFHAAAYKHVPMMEIQPSEAIKNNSLGTAALAELVREFKVERFLMISTDKAVNPTSIMGASKRLAEIYLQALSAAHPTPTRFIAVRFGNVLGSSGSVVPTFTRQIAAGGPVTVTHPDIVRYFMTIPEAVGLVLQSCAQGDGGEIFVLDMGKPVKIVDLARQMIELSGLRPDTDIEIKFTGLRSGEKLFEELNCSGENYKPTQHPRIMRFLSSPRSLPEVQRLFEHIEAGIYKLDDDALKQSLLTLVPEYTPFQKNKSNGTQPAAVVAQA